MAMCDEATLWATVLLSRMHSVEIGKGVWLIYHIKRRSRGVTKKFSWCTCVYMRKLAVLTSKGGIFNDGRQMAQVLHVYMKTISKIVSPSGKYIHDRRSLNFLFDISSICIVNAYNNDPHQTYGDSLLGSLGNKLASLTLGRPSQSMTIRSRPIPPPA
jgi:hypothetical protein